MTEMAVLAAECRFGTLHVCDLYGRTETIPAAGGLRELVGTSYVRTRVPVVRFRTGDLCNALEPAECRCGLPGQAIRALRGRAVEVVELPDGRILTASPLADVLRRVPGMVWSRFEILAPDRWRLRYHAAGPCDDVVLAEVRKELARRAEGVSVEAAFDPAPAPPPGKSRLVVDLRDRR
jgi:phenylacetate-coenzyme A ligase PaaK-like adenylate-forming protein